MSREIRETPPNPAKNRPGERDENIAWPGLGVHHRRDRFRPRSGRPKQGQKPLFSGFPRRLLPGSEETPAQLSSIRRSSSISSAMTRSLARNSSILRTACITVVWSRPPNLRPISGSERGVNCLHKYIAT